MTAIKTLVLGVLFVHLFGGQAANAQTAGETAAQIGQFLDGSGDMLSPADRRFVEGKLEDVEYVLEEYGYSRTSVFRTALEGNINPDLANQLEPEHTFYFAIAEKPATTGNPQT